MDRLKSPQHGIPGRADRKSGVSEWCANRSRLAAVFLGISVVSCVGVRASGGMGIEKPSAGVAMSQAPEKGGKWGFMSESQRESAQRILELPCEMIEREIRTSKDRGSKASEIPYIFDLIQAAAELRRVLRQGTQGQILEKARQFFSVAESMEGGESERKFKELSSDPDSEFDVRMFQSYFASAVGDAMNLADIRGE